jgi:hypothetical protein
VASSSANRQRHPLSRTYGVILQSSLTSVLPSALDFSSRLPVSVLVRSLELQPLEAFLGRSSDDISNINAIGPDRWLMRADLPTLAASQSTDSSSCPLTIQTPSLHRSTPVAQEC